MLYTIVRVIVAVAAMTAAILWFNSARIEVPDNIDTIVQELQRIGYWNGWAARCSCFAAFLGAVDVVLTTIESAQYVYRAIAQQTGITTNRRFRPFVYCEEVRRGFGVGS